MKLKSIVELAAVFLDMTDLIESGVFLFEEPCPEAVAVQSSSKNLRKLITSANNVLREVAADFAPLKTSEDTAVNFDGKIPFNSLKRTISRPLALYNKEGLFIPYKQAHDGIIPIGGGNNGLKLEYAFLPSNAPLYGEVEVDGRVNVAVLAYGTACEYALISGLTDAAYIWHRRYCDGLNASLGTKKIKVLPAWKWA
jgi:hypothetical protein